MRTKAFAPVRIGSALDLLPSAFATAMEAPLGKAGIYNVGADHNNFTIGEIAEMVAAEIPGTKVVYHQGSDDARSSWSLEGPLFKGWKVTAAARTSAGRTLVATASDVYGPAIHVSDDLTTWRQTASAAARSSSAMSETPWLFISALNSASDRSRCLATNSNVPSIISFDGLIPIALPA